MVLPVCLAQIVYQCLMLHFPLKIVIYVEGSKIRNSHDVDYKTRTSYVNFVTFSFLFSLQNTLLEQEKINLRVEWIQISPWFLYLYLVKNVKISNNENQKVLLEVLKEPSQSVAETENAFPNKHHVSLVLFTVYHIFKSCFTKCIFSKVWPCPERRKEKNRRLPPNNQGLVLSITKGIAN